MMNHQIADLGIPADSLRSGPALAIEPQICRQAAFSATAADIAELGLCAERCRSASSWRHYENWDNRFHRAIAQATHNSLLLALFDTLNAVRRAIVWGRLRSDKPPSSHHSYDEHEIILRAIEERNLGEAAAAMAAHIEAVGKNMVK